jgi:putative hydrolase of the HAD superfamily
MRPHPPRGLAQRKSCWVFDLDNTLYPPQCDLLAEIDRRMTDYVAQLTGLPPAEARILQKRYHDDHGATLTGMIAHHGADPRAFLDYVHALDLSPLQPDPDLARLIADLPGRKFVFTNADRGHADRVSRRLGLHGLFDDYFDIEAGGYAPKPQAVAFATLVARHAIDPHTVVMFDDLARNLAPAAALGFTTVLVARPPAEPLPDSVHFVAEDLKLFLREALREQAA